MSKKILPSLLIPLGKAIRDARLDFRMSTMALSAEVKLAPSTLRQIEAGTCGRLMCVRKVAEYLGVPLPEDF